MRKSAIGLAFVISALFGVVGQAWALQVSDIRVRSHLNEPLVATIPVQVANIQERNSLAATLAPDTEYVARGLPPLDNPDDLIIQVVEGNALEQMLIEVRSLSSIEDPFLSLVLQLIWDGGSEVREFTVLLDPAPAPIMAEEPVTEEQQFGLAPAEEDAEAAADAAALNALAESYANEPGVTVSQPGPDVVIRKISPDEYLSGQPGAATASGKPAFTGDRYGPVAAGETLWRIATKVRPSNQVSMAQVMEAIYQANPAAFAGSYETLKKGSMLTIPGEQAMLGTAPGDTGRRTASTGTAAEPGAESAPASPEPEAAETASLWQQPEKTEVDSSQREQKGGLITKPSKPPVLPQSAADAAGADGGTAPAEPASDFESFFDESADSGKVDYGDAAEPDAGAKAGAEDTATLDEMPPTEQAAGEAAEPVEETASEPVQEPAEDASGESDGSQTTYLAAVILIVLLLTYWWYRRRARREQDLPAAYAMPLTEEAQAVPQDLPEPPLAEPPAETFDSGIPGAAQIDEAPLAEEHAADDALTQAETYLSYGLYESAADSLQKGIEAEPARSDLRLKLLETQEAASNQEAFVSAVQDWEASDAPMDDSLRDRISAMGSRVAPGVALFGAAAAATDGEATAAEERLSAPATTEEPAAEEDLPLPDFDLDTTLDEPGEEAESVALNLDDELAPEPEAEEEPGPVEDLELPDLDLEVTPTGTDFADSSETTEKPAQETDISSLDFDLDELESPAADASPAIEEAPAEPVADFSDTGDLDLTLEPEADAAAGAEAPAAAPDTDSDAEYDVKLDLAQAYLDMGEPDLAKGLLDEVIEGGNPGQRDTAQNLLKTLD